jgi:hypothetical protein
MELKYIYICVKIKMIEKGKIDKCVKYKMTDKKERKYRKKTSSINGMNMLMPMYPSFFIN